jgi:uncharacterized protein involved in exopolysaccharide biosynthesis
MDLSEGGNSLPNYLSDVQAVDKIASIADSETIRGKVIERFSLGSKDFRKDYTVTTIPASGTVKMTYASGDTHVGLEVLSYAIEEADRISRKMASQAASDRADQLAVSLSRIKGELRAAEDLLAEKQSSESLAEVSGGNLALADLGARKRSVETELSRVRAELDRTRSKEMGMVSLKGSAQTGIPEIDALSMRISVLRADLSAAKVTGADESVEVVKLQQTITALENDRKASLEALAELAKQNKSAATSALAIKIEATQAQLDAIELALSEAPASQKTVSRLEREVQMLAEVATQVQAQYEAAKVDVASTPLKWQVLDEPFVANNGEPVGPGAGTFGLVGLLGSLSLILGAKVLGQRQAEQGQ